LPRKIVFSVLAKSLIARSASRRLSPKAPAPERLLPACRRLMATEADVRAVALSLPGTTEEQWYQTPGYKVAGKGFLRLRTEAEEGGLVVFVSDLGVKEALLTSNPDAFFTTPHYDGYPVVLVDLDNVDHEELRELIIDSWLIKAPPKLRRQLEDQ
jgi:hypothetical protein